MLPATNQPPRRLLMGPGPSSVHPRVTEAIARPLVGHLDPHFLRVMDEIQTMLRREFRAAKGLPVAVPGTGSAGMEAAILNSIEAGDEILVCVNGVFGTRMCDIVERCGGVLRRIDRPWGEVFDPEEVQSALAKHPAVKAVAIVHAETSTGAHQPLEAIGRLCRDSDRLFIVDCVTSFCGAPLEVDAWNIDVAYSGTQKCLSCPPGLAPLLFGERALDRLRKRKTKVPSWYLDLTMIEKYWNEGSRAYHHTAPVAMNYALHEALQLVEEEGLEARWERHRKNSQILVSGLEALGFKLFAREGRRLPMLNAVWIPEGSDDARIRRRLLDEYNIEIGGGLGAVAGKIWRIGLMGETSTRENVMRFLAALEEILFSERRPPSPKDGGSSGAARIGAGLEAASRVPY